MKPKHTLLESDVSLCESLGFELFARGKCESGLPPMDMPPVCLLDLLQESPDAATTKDAAPASAKEAPALATEAMCFAAICVPR